MDITNDAIERTHDKLTKEAESGGYHLNPDLEFTKDLVKGLLTNEQRYGYWACPCRLATGTREIDLDMICPCDYRDPDLDEFGACFCGLYVSSRIAKGEQALESIPDRRLVKPNRALENKLAKTLTLPVWRCKVCGYLCARDHPPEVCPICKVRRERFERFI